MFSGAKSTERAQLMRAAYRGRRRDYHLARVHSKTINLEAGINSAKSFLDIVPLGMKKMRFLSFFWVILKDGMLFKVDFILNQCMYKYLGYSTFRFCMKKIDISRIIYV